MGYDPAYTGPKGNDPASTAAYNTWLQANGKGTAPMSGNGYTQSPSSGAWTRATEAPSSAPPKYQSTSSAPWSAAGSGLDFSKQGSGEQWWDTSGKSGYGAPTAGEQWWSQYGGQFNAPSYSEQTFNAANSQIGPSALDAWYRAAGNPYAKQTAGEQYGSGVMARYGSGNTPNGTNYSQQYYQQYGGAPQLSADLAPYYQDAERRANEQINQQMAARGMFGSSAAADQGREAMVQLEAQRAKDEAQYGLQRAGELRGWEQLGGQLAGQSDQQSLANAQNKLAWTTGIGDLLDSSSKLGLGRAQGTQGLLSTIDQEGIDRGKAYMDIAGAADAGRMSRLTGGQSGALGTGSQELSRLGGGTAGSAAAQGLQRTRGQDYLSNTGGLTNSLSAILGSGYGGMMSSDQTLLQGALDAILGRSAEAVNQGNIDRQQTQGDISNAIALVGVLGSLYKGSK